MCFPKTDRIYLYFYWKIQQLALIELMSKYKFGDVVCEMFSRICNVARF